MRTKLQKIILGLMLSLTTATIIAAPQYVDPRRVSVHFIKPIIKSPGVSVRYDGREVFSVLVNSSADLVTPLQLRNFFILKLLDARVNKKMIALENCMVSTQPCGRFSVTQAVHMLGFTHCDSQQQCSINPNLYISAQDVHLRGAKLKPEYSIYGRARELMTYRACGQNQHEFCLAYEQFSAQLQTAKNQGGCVEISILPVKIVSQPVPTPAPQRTILRKKVEVEIEVLPQPIAPIIVEETTGPDLSQSPALPDNNDPNLEKELKGDDGTHSVLIR